MIWCDSRTHSVNKEIELNLFDFLMSVSFLVALFVMAINLIVSHLWHQVLNDLGLLSPSHSFIALSKNWEREYLTSLGLYCPLKFSYWKMFILSWKKIPNVSIVLTYYIFTFYQFKVFFVIVLWIMSWLESVANHF